MRPAEVCGWTRYPSCSRTAISLRTVAEETRTPGAWAMWVEPTGNAVAMYSCTTALRIAVLRSSSLWHSTLPTATRRGRLDHRARGQGAAAPARQHEDGTAGCRQRDEAAVRQR